MILLLSLAYIVLPSSWFVTACIVAGSLAFARSEEPGDTFEA